MFLLHDKGLEEYDAVRAAYDKAIALLQAENPNRKELSDLVKIFDENKKGAEWLKLEEGEKYDNVYKAIKQKVPRALRVSHLAIILFNKHYVIRIGTGYMVEHFTNKIEKEVTRQFQAQIRSEEELLMEYDGMIVPMDKLPKAEYLSPELSASIEDYCEHILNGKQFDKDYIENTRKLIASMVHRGVK